MFYRSTCLTDEKMLYFAANALCIVLAAVYYSVLVWTALPFGRRLKVFLVFLAFFQVLPVGMLFVGAGTFLLELDEGRLKDKKLRERGVLTMISCSTLAEALIEAVFGVGVQAYSFIHDTDLVDDAKSTLKLSIIIGLCSLTKGYAIMLNLMPKIALCGLWTPSPLSQAQLERLTRDYFLSDREVCSDRVSHLKACRGTPVGGCMALWTSGGVLDICSDRDSLGDDSGTSHY